MAMGGVDRLTAEVGWHGMSHECAFIKTG